MKVSDSQKLVFVHIHKTGGMTMEHVLSKNVPDIRGERARRHASLAKILVREPALTHYWIFGIVRNPWARMFSLWSMTQRLVERAGAGDRGATRLLEKHAIWRTGVRYPDFDTFLREGPKDVARIGTPQVSWLTTPTRRADYIGRTENFDEVIQVVYRRLGLPPPEEVPHKNQGSHGSYHDYYSKAGRDRVAELFAPDIEEFGYSF